MLSARELADLIRRRAAEKALFLAAGKDAALTPSLLVRPRPDVRAASFVPARRPTEIEAPLVMKSLGAAVRTSNGTPPEARIAALTSTATPSR